MNDAAKTRVRDQFLDCLQRLGSARAACRAAKLPRSTLYKWRETLPDFAEEWREALAAAGGPRSPGMGDATGTRISEIR
jgi:hypothetical protein